MNLFTDLAVEARVRRLETMVLYLTALALGEPLTDEQKNVLRVRQQQLIDLINETVKVEDEYRSKTPES